MGRRSVRADEIRREFRRSALAFLAQLRSLRPPESVYALLFEISDQDPGAWPIGATEESLGRFVGDRRNRRGTSSGLLRAEKRWEAPGDTPDLWYWGDEAVSERLNGLLERAFVEDDVDSGRAYRVTRRLCLSALADLNREGAFGIGPARESLVVGISNVECDFGDFLRDLSTVNPPKVMRRLRSELRKARHASQALERERP